MESPYAHQNLLHCYLPTSFRVYNDSVEKAPGLQSVPNAMQTPDAEALAFTSRTFTDRLRVNFRGRRRQRECQTQLQRCPRKRYPSNSTLRSSVMAAIFHPLPYTLADRHLLGTLKNTTPTLQTLDKRLRAGQSSKHPLPKQHVFRSFHQSPEAQPLCDRAGHHSRLTKPIRERQLHQGAFPGLRRCPEAQPHGDIPVPRSIAASARRGTVPAISCECMLPTASR